ncbi:MAG: hypothetical protein ACI8RD_013000 [Bacillariaceae sp.]|jgi:hypothetical protein
MKFTSLIAVAATATAMISSVVVVVEAVPDCKLSEVGDYKSCKGEFNIKSDGADSLFCISLSDCEKVFASGNDNAVTTNEVAVGNPAATISAAIESVEVSSSPSTTTTTGLVLLTAVAAISGTVMLL